MDMWIWYAIGVALLSIGSYNLGALLAEHRMLRELGADKEEQ